MARPGTPWEKICTVLCVVILLVGAAALYSHLGEGRASGGGVREKDGQQLQMQIDELKRTLSKLAAENEIAKIGMAECSLKRQELVVCTDNLAKAQREIGRCQKWATDVDDENQARGMELDLTNQDLQQERKRSAEAEQRVFSISEMLEKTKSALKAIEMQKLEATAKYEAERQKEIALEEELKKEKGLPGGGSKDRVEKLQKLIDEMNEDLSKKELRVTELMQQKKESDRSLRKLENKLMEAGVDPADIQKVGQGASRTTASPPAGVNPAALAALQVASSRVTAPQAGQVDKGTATAEVELLFDAADANKDQTLDLSEVLQVVTKRFPTNIPEPERQLRLANAMRLFKILDADGSGFVDKAKALRHPRTAARLLRGQTSLLDMAAETSGTSGTGAAAAAVPNLFNQMMEQQKKVFDQVSRQAAEKASAQQRMAGRVLEPFNAMQLPQPISPFGFVNATQPQGRVQQPVGGLRLGQAVVVSGGSAAVAPSAASAAVLGAARGVSSSGFGASMGGLGATSAAMRTREAAAAASSVRRGVPVGGLAAATRAKDAAASAAASLGSAGASLGGLPSGLTAASAALRAAKEASSAARAGNAGAALVGVKAAVRLR